MFKESLVLQTEPKSSKIIEASACLAAVALGPLTQLPSPKLLLQACDDSFGRRKHEEFPKMCFSMKLSKQFLPTKLSPLFHIYNIAMLVIAMW